MMYAEIILPLPLYGTYTYGVPTQMAPNVAVGMRVLVQFGRKKIYTGVIASLHDKAPDYEIKELICLLDKTPILRYPQLKLWSWISEYYLCPAGDVLKAALPSGLKPESETQISLNSDFGTPEGVQLSERQANVIMLLEQKKRMRISEVEKELQSKDAAQTVNHLMELGIIRVDEKVVEKYRPKRETYVSLLIERGDEEGLHKLFDSTSRSRHQEKALIAWLDMSGWLQKGKTPREVTKRELMENAEVTPAVLKAMSDKGIFRMEKRVVNRFNHRSADREPLPELSEAQHKALQGIKGQLTEKQTVLLHGVTGSGKTEIYSHLIDETLRGGNHVLFLVPEISLTTQLTDRLRKTLGDRLLVYHSKFSDSERVDIWKQILESSTPVVVLGARSSVFLPFGRLGLVIVDEEHESSYKQYDPAPRYNARDTAIVLASLHGAKVVLGSATPSVETYNKALDGKFGLVTLSERFKGARLPEVEIVDMREQRKKKLNNGILSAPLSARIREAITGGKQAILFQNRRGFAPIVVCRQCGWTPKCDNCDVSLVYHKHNNLLKCHYCGFTRPLPPLCPACGQNSVATFGYGTERIAEDVVRAFPQARISRMDLDTTRNKDAYQELIEEFGRHETDILVGTQMISKGLDFGDVKIAGVINADTLLNFPDFRSNERAFNMLEQVAGRAGRREEKGIVLIQTTDPSNPVLGFVKQHHYKGFYEMEIQERLKFGYPPFTKVINIYLRNKDRAMVDDAAVTLAKKLRETFGTRVLGPEKPFVSRVALWYIQSIMLKIETGASMQKVKALLRSSYESVAGTPSVKSTQIYYDVDPS